MKCITRQFERRHPLGLFGQVAVRFVGGRERHLFILCAGLLSLLATLSAPRTVTAQIAQLAEVPRRTFRDWLAPGNESRAVWQPHAGTRLNITEPGREVSQTPHPAVVRSHRR